LRLPLDEVAAEISSLTRTQHPFEKHLVITYNIPENQTVPHDLNTSDLFVSLGS